jgi:hypothetical protein
LDEAFSEACLWILERRAGDPRFASVNPAPPEHGAGISFEVSGAARIELSRAIGSQTLFLGYATRNRDLHDRLWRTGGGTEEAVSIHLSECFEQAGLRESFPVERIHDTEDWIAIRVRMTPDELASVEGRERILRMIEGFHLAFPPGNAFSR